jgi:pimeloyl-ACP methyl ester carboxylesterase
MMICFFLYRHFRSPLIKDQLSHNDEDYFEKHLTSTNIPIIIYLHGNAFDRYRYDYVDLFEYKGLFFIFSSILARRKLCKRLRDELKYDVITFDYRGFGDSTGEVTENGLVKDARFIYDWLYKLSNGQRKIYLWGHSLGSAVACQLAAQLSEDESMNYIFFYIYSKLFFR